MSTVTTGPDRLAVLPTLSTAMREGSKAEHEAAEGSAFMTELLAGRVNEQGYADYLRRLRAVYATMESLVSTSWDEHAVTAVHDPALERLAAIDADLAHWAPGVPADAPLDSPATQAYCARLTEVAGWGPALVAHHYTRYLGDLSGGQAIGRILDRSFELDGYGTAFYAFPSIPKPKPYKDAYRGRLDALGLSETEIARVVDEVKVAFTLNQALFVELSALLPGYRRVGPN